MCLGRDSRSEKGTAAWDAPGRLARSVGDRRRETGRRCSGLARDVEGAPPSSCGSKGRGVHGLRSRLQFALAQRKLLFYPRKDAETPVDGAE